ncbi:response regulator transcription factor [Vallitalea pronyensis]|uniref:Stage 0 sporulation protein A homolog n=1 Tax=Vallitalea pronyensis TaxID=1348613 RepID=A0A8J8MK73_9FIRM|nr:LytTR family DNA-binding domain-containing protein [Vallitalea pronyensis]QUI23357.1 response regulator transcription factor [Vallitalea pronyensis]
MLNVILVDDEKPALQELSFLLGQHKHINIIGMYMDASEALEAIIHDKPDVVFLDIEMPVLNGYAIALDLHKRHMNTDVIFVTAYDDYAIKAFELNVVDYILKPYDEQRIDETIKRLLDKRSYSKLLHPIDDNIICHNCIEKIPVWDGDCIAIISPEDILFCTLSNGEIIIETATNKYKSHNTLSELEATLKKHHFFRCHRSYLINMDKIEKIIPWFNHTFVVKMKHSCVEIPVSRRQIKTFKQILNL